MTDRLIDPETWVLRNGDLDVAGDERAALIRGLYELAAWVAENPDVALPEVSAHVPARGDDWESECAEVGRAGASLGVAPVSRLAGQFYLVDARFGPVEVKSVAIRADYMDAYEAHMAEWEAARRAERAAAAEASGVEGGEHL